MVKTAERDAAYSLLKPRPSLNCKMQNETNNEKLHGNIESAIKTVYIKGVTCVGKTLHIVQDALLHMWNVRNKAYLLHPMYFPVIHQLSNYTCYRSTGCTGFRHS